MSAPSVRPALLALAVSGLAAPRSAEAVFHLWEIREVYSNENGSIQYIELSTTFAGQGFVNAHDITATSDGVERTFTFDSNVVGDTTDRTLLIATPEFTAVAGAAVPDYTLPCGPFFDPDAVDITIDFVGADSVDFAGADLPADSADALYFTIAGATSTAVNTPQNFAGVDGFLAPSACEYDGSCDLCDDGLFCTGAESCPDDACDAPGDPCAFACDEDLDVCIECFVPADCDDANPCTDEGCTAGLCSNDPGAGACDDGLFCTETDSCAAGVCVGAGDACPGTNCNEGTDVCADCLADADCEDGDPCTADTCDVAGACQTADAAAGTPCADDGLFCSGRESCAAGACASGGDPCAADETCSEEEGLCRGCGDGRLDAGEVCDDGDTDDGDGCSANCAVEDGFVCDVDVEPTVCVPEKADPDAGAGDSDSDSDSDSDADADVDAGAPRPRVKKDSGCGCSASSSRTNAGWLALGLLSVVSRRRAGRA